MEKNMKTEKNRSQRWGSAVDSEDGLNLHGSVDIISLKACVSPIKTAANLVILIDSDLPLVNIKTNQYFTPL